MNVYAIIFPNGKKYVGIESYLGGRFKRHKEDARRGVMRPLYCAIRKYGEELCQLQYIYKDMPREFCMQLEKQLIKSLKLQDRQFGYNLANGGEVGPTGFKHSEEWKKKASIISTGKTHSEDTKERMSESQKGKPRNPESIAKMRATKLARYAVMTPEQRREITKGCRTVEARAKNAASQLTRPPISDETRQKLSEGITRSYAEGKRVPTKGCIDPESKKKVSESLKLAYANGTRQSRKGVPRNLQLLN